MKIQTKTSTWNNDISTTTNVSEKTKRPKPATKKI